MSQDGLLEDLVTLLDKHPAADGDAYPEAVFLVRALDAHRAANVLAATRYLHPHPPLPLPDDPT